MKEWATLPKTSGGVKEKPKTPGAGRQADICSSCFKRPATRFLFFRPSSQPTGPLRGRHEVFTGRVFRRQWDMWEQAIPSVDGSSRHEAPSLLRS